MLATAARAPTHGRHRVCITIRNFRASAGCGGRISQLQIACLVVIKRQESGADEENEQKGNTQGTKQAAAIGGEINDAFHKGQTSFQ